MPQSEKEIPRLGERKMATTLRTRAAHLMVRLPPELQQVSQQGVAIKGKTREGTQDKMVSQFRQKTQEGDEVRSHENEDTQQRHCGVVSIKPVTSRSEKEVGHPPTPSSF